MCVVSGRFDGDVVWCGWDRIGNLYLFFFFLIILVVFVEVVRICLRKKEEF